MWSGIEFNEKDIRGEIIVMEIDENTRKIENNVYDYYLKLKKM